MEKKKAKSTTASKKTTTKKVVKAEEVKETAKVVEKTEPVKEVKTEEVKKGKYTAFKVLGIIILVVAVLTWFIKSGSWTYDTNDAAQTFATFTENEEPVRTGINELFLSIYYGINYYLIQIVFLGILGLFYGVISKTKGYKSMVKKIASLFKGKEILFTLIGSLLIAGLASLITQPLVLLIFIPMLYSVAKELKLSKVSAMLMTFGALAVGLMGVTYGSYGITYASQNIGIEMTEGIAYRAIILVVGYLLLNVFIALFNKQKKKVELAEDHFEVIESDVKGKAWPYFLIFGLLLVFTVLGYVAWDTAFNIDVFSNFHTWLTTEVVIGENTPIFGYILGNVTAFGTWDPYVISYILLIVMIFVKFFARIKWDELFENALSGLKKMAKPIILVILAYSIFVLCYWSGITNTIVNFFNSGDKFNPYFNWLGNVVADFLHVDVEYTGFAFGQFYASKFADATTQILAILSAASGFVALVAPTSIFMLTGLSLSDLSIKDYFKAIWKFIVALLVVLCIIFAVIAFI